MTLINRRLWVISNWNGLFVQPMFSLLHGPLEKSVYYFEKNTSNCLQEMRAIRSLFQFSVLFVKNVSDVPCFSFIFQVVLECLICDQKEILLMFLLDFSSSYCHHIKFRNIYIKNTSKNNIGRIVQKERNESWELRQY